ncbi:MAG: hypothetical protein NTY09_00450 [bacterium]|nr:hypothetical protein [bacterium]
MYTFSPIRLLVIMVYFLACTACGQPAGQTAQNSSDADQGSTATDINFIGGGTQAPDIQPVEEPYRSPTLSTLPPPTELNFFSTIDQAVRIAEGDDRYRICVFFFNNECDECRTIEQTVFLDPEVVKLTRYWLFVKVDSDQNQDLTNYYIQGAEPPAFVFLDRTGNEYRKYFGPVSSEEFITMMTGWR